MEVNNSIFRENDIRGIYPDQLNESTIALIGKAISHKCRSEGISTISVGRDGRLSGKSLLNSFCQSLVNEGLHVTNIGMVTSPMLYFEAKTNESKSGIIITGSHNPKNHNGLKMVINDKPISGMEILSLIDELQDTSYPKGSLVDKDIKENYLIRPIDPSFVPEIKTYPNRRIICIIGAMLGGILSLMIVVLRSFLVNK